MPQLFHRMATKIFGQEIANFGLKKKAFFRTILLQFFGERRREFLAKGMVGHSFPQERREFYGDACAIFQVMMQHFFRRVA